MALQIHSSSCFTSRSYHLHHLFATRNPRFAIKCQNPQTKTETTEDPVQPRKSSSSGVGFGSLPSSSPSSTSVKKGKVKREVIRRTPVEKPVFMSEEGAAMSEEQRRNENAFLLTWLGLGIVILVEGLILREIIVIGSPWNVIAFRFIRLLKSMSGCLVTDS